MASERFVFWRRELSWISYEVPSDDPAVFTNNANESFAIDIAVPTVSDWGLAVMMLVVLTTGSIVIKRRGRRSVAKPLH